MALLIGVLFSCNKDDFPTRPIEDDALKDCYNQTEWSNAKIKEVLIGKWKWVFEENYWAWGKGNNTENENVRIEFFRDSTLNYWVEDSIEFTTKWMVTPAWGKTYSLLLDSSITKLYGTILLCDDIIVFKGSYGDLSDNYYKKIH